MQGRSDFRKQIHDLYQLKVRSERGGMVPLGSMAEIKDVSGPVLIMRYNMYPSAAINGDAAPGVSSGQAIDTMEECGRARDLPQAMRTEWTELAYLAAPDRQHGDVRLRPGRRPGLPGPGGAV